MFASSALLPLFGLTHADGRSFTETEDVERLNVVVITVAIELEKIEDIKDIMTFGIMSTPGS